MNHPDFTRLPDEALIRLYTLKAWGLVPFSPSTLWRKCGRGEFPQPIKVSANVTGFRVGDVRTWLKDPANFRAKGYAPNQKEGK